MRRALGAVVACAWLATLSACGPRYRHVVERPLPSHDDLSCSGFLVWSQEPVGDVFLVVNGSGYLSNAFVHPSFEDTVAAHDVAYGTYDKPGVRAPFGDPASVTRDDELFQRYTLGHGVACAVEALRWARDQFGPAVRLHLRGHSEGTLVSLYAYDALLEADPELAGMIHTLILSGVALEPFGDILERQLGSLPDGDDVRAALTSCDWSVLRDRLRVSCAYVDDALARPSGRTMFERLAARAAPARFHVVHGETDWHTPVEPVRELEAWNGSDRHLSVVFHYYDGGHAGSDAARADVAEVVAAIVSE